MYHWLEDTDFLGRVESTCADVINRLVQQINAEGKMRVKQHLVGSGARNLIVQNGQEPIDLDYNLEIIDFGEFQENDCQNIKTYTIRKFNEILKAKNWGDCQDSTSAITTKKRKFKKGNPTLFSIDLCITSKSNESWRRLIHKKTGSVSYDQYYWNEAPNSRQLEYKVECLKNAKIWNKVRDTYMEKKNMYLRRHDNDHPSFIVYIETVNEIYAKYNTGHKNLGLGIKIIDKSSLY